MMLVPIVASLAGVAAGIQLQRENLMDLPYDEILYITMLPGYTPVYQGYAQAKVGWLPGPAVIKNDHNGHDEFQVFKKGCTEEDGIMGYCDMCAFAFAGTNEGYDSAQFFNTSRPAFCGLDSGIAGGGYVDEVRTMMEQPGYAAVVESIKEGECGTTIISGHSMGGGFASTFAFCVNHETADTVDKPNVAELPTVKLVTYGGGAPALEPLYSGVPGNCFEGARFFMAEGSESAQVPDDFHIATLNMMADVYEANGDDRADYLRNDVIPNLCPSQDGCDLKEAAIEAIHTEQLEKWEEYLAGRVGTPTLTNPIVDDYVSTWGNIVWRYTTDGIPSRMPNVQPLINAVPLYHFYTDSEYTTWDVNSLLQIKVVTGSPAPGASCAESYKLPAINPMQQVIGARMAAAFLGSGGAAALPNHMPCCYAGAFVSDLGGIIDGQEVCPPLFGDQFGAILACQGFGLR